MNPSSVSSFASAATLPRDAVQVQSFATAGEINFSYLNATLGISLSTFGYRRLQKHFFEAEKKNPTLGELRLLGYLAGRYPLARRLGPTAVYTDSSVIMETWADIMEGWTAISGKFDKPCTLSDVLSLPAAYVYRTPSAVLRHDPILVTSSTGDAEALTDGYTPIATLESSDGTQRRLWNYDKDEILESTADVDVGDVLLAIPAVSREALLAFWEAHPFMAFVKGKAAVGNSPFLPVALGLCGGRGLAANPLTLTDADACRHNPVEAYLERWESPLPEGMVRGIICIPPHGQASVYTALAEHGFSPHVLGTVIKQPRFTLNDGILTTVNLHINILRDLVDIKPYAATLPTPAVLPATHKGSLTVVAPAPLPGGIGTAAEVTLSMTGDEGFAETIRGVCALCGEMATVGIPYDRITLSPVLYVSGKSESPLLLSAVCGLYRACTELGIPMIHPEILFKLGDDMPPALTISMMGYATEESQSLPESLAGTEHSLHLWTLPDAPAWDDIRRLFFKVAQAVKTGKICSAHPLWNEGLLDCLASGSLSKKGVGAALFEAGREQLSAPVPIGFFLAGCLEDLPGQIGVTHPLENMPAAISESAPPPAWIVKVCERVPLHILKDQETKRRKEISAMEKIKAFQPLCKVPRTVLLDTDIGPDCDDVGALAVLIYYAKQYGFPIGGICNCTSNKAGNGVIDAVCRRCGIETPPLGQWHGEGFMDSEEHCKYNVAVAEAHSEAYRNGTLVVDDEVTYYRKRLAAAKDGEVMVISIGMFNNLAALLESPADGISPLTGMELIKAKVYALVSMAAILPQGRECNVVSDYKSCEKVFGEWPTPIYLSDFHIGVNVKTGYGHITDPETIAADPLPMSYHLYTKEWNWEGAIKGQNASYDLTAVQFAAIGEGELYGLDTPGDLEFYAEIPDLPDATRFVANPMGNKIFMTKKVDDQVIANSLQKILESF